MVDKQIQDLAADTTPASGDVVETQKVGGGAGSSKQVTLDDVITQSAPEATVSVKGVMSAADKTKLDDVATNATANPSALDNVLEDTTPQLGGALDVNGNAITSASAGDIPITPDTTGNVILDGVKWPQADGTVGQHLETDGAGQSSWGTPNIDFAELATDLSDTMDLAVGASLDTPAVTVTSNGTVILLNLEKEGTGDVRYLFTDGVHIHDCTPIDTVTLTAGSDISPQINYIYILQSTKVLTSSTVSFPDAEHAPVATVLCQSAASLQTYNAYKVHAWTDHSIKHVGHLSHLNHWIRHQPATWGTGTGLTPTVGLNIFDIATASGTILQLHDHAYPAFDSSTGSDIYIVNDSVTAYSRVGDLTGLVLDADGNTLGGSNSDYYNLVIWGVVSEATGDCKLMCNLPSGSYNSDAGGKASVDMDKTAIYTIPAEFIGTGFLIARLTVSVSGSVTYVIEQNEDLRGFFPGSTAGGGAIGGNEFADNVFRVQDNADVTKELALEVSGVTTGTVRTLTVPDENGTIITDQRAATLTQTGVIEVATVAETNTGTDATRAVSPDGLDGWTGSAQVVTVGTLTSGNVDAAVSAATETLAGKAELSTQAEAEAGANDTTVMTPLKTSQAITALAPSGAFAFTSVLEKTATYTILSGDASKMISCDGTFTLTLPTSFTSVGELVGVVNKGTGVITISAGTDGINQAGTDTFLVQPDEMVIITYGNAADPKWRAAINPYPVVYNGTAAPAITPTKVGDIFIDTTNEVSYSATGVASSADWKNTSAVSSLADTVTGVPYADGADWVVRKDNMVATTDPGAGDDTADGYIIGSKWFNVTLDKLFVALDVTAATAVWKELSGGTITQLFDIPISLDISGGNGDYSYHLGVGFPYTVVDLDKCILDVATSTATVTLKINTTVITGISVAATDTEQVTADPATAANDLVADDTLKITIASVANAPQLLAGVIHCTRTLTF